jgi:hypothetical protein
MSGSELLGVHPCHISGCERKQPTPQVIRIVHLCEHGGVELGLRLVRGPLLAGRVHRENRDELGSDVRGLEPCDE